MLRAETIESFALCLFEIFNCQSQGINPHNQYLSLNPYTVRTQAEWPSEINNIQIKGSRPSMIFIDSNLSLIKSTI